MLGSNDNPTVIDFKRVYRKLMVCHEIVYDGNKGNCITNETGILTVSSEIVPKPASSQYGRSKLIDLDDVNYEEFINEELEKVDEHLNACIASKVEQKIEHMHQRQKNKCKLCLKVFHENEKAKNKLLSRNARSTSENVENQPCEDTVKIIKFFNKLNDLLPDKGYDFKAIVETCFFHLNPDSLFISTEFDDHIEAEMNDIQSSPSSHKNNFIKEIIKCYANMKAQKIGRKITDEERGEYVRHTNRKNTHFAGQ